MASTPSSVDLPAPLPKPEEIANCITHALGCVLSIAGTVVLTRAMAQYGDTVQIVGVSVYGATLVALYAASTLSHSFEQPQLRHFFRTVDQVCIFLLIAGTYTPVALTYLREGWWWTLFITVWGCAIAGIFFKLFFTRLQNVSVSAYVLLGWLPVVGIKPIIETMPVPAMLWFAAGGLCYTIGVVFLLRDDRVPFFHATWHVLVIAGSACHYYAVLTYMVPWPA
jgi:hemolysin III